MAMYLAAGDSSIASFKCKLGPMRTLFRDLLATCYGFPGNTWVECFLAATSSRSCHTASALRSQVCCWAVAHASCPIWRQRSGLAHRARSNPASSWESSGSRKIIPFVLSLIISLAPARELATTGKPQAMADEDAIAGFSHGGTPWLSADLQRRWGDFSSARG